MNNKDKVYIVISMRKNWKHGLPTSVEMKLETLEIYTDQNTANGRAQAIVHYDKALLNNAYSIFDTNKNTLPETYTNDVEVFADNYHKFVAVCTSHTNKDIILKTSTDFLPKKNKDEEEKLFNDLFIPAKLNKHQSVDISDDTPDLDDDFAEVMNKNVNIINQKFIDAKNAVMKLINSGCVEDEVVACLQAMEKVKTPSQQEILADMANDIVSEIEAKQKNNVVDLPAGWDLNNKPILESQVKFDPWYVKLTSELSDQQRRALVIARIRKQPNYMGYVPFSNNTSSHVPVFNTFTQKQVLSEISNNTYNANIFITRECELLDNIINKYRGDDANWEDEESSSSEEDDYQYFDYDT